MADLDYSTVKSIEDLFEMETGYVIDFSNSSFQRFIKGNIGIDIYEDENYKEYCSKANKLRQIIESESILIVDKLINELLNYYENFRLKDNKLTVYDNKKITDIKRSLDDSIKKVDSIVIIHEDLDELFQMISTRQASFMEMAIDERLKEIGNLIEYLLKQDGKYIKLNYDCITLGFLNESHVKDLRGKIQCFRHSTHASLEERKGYTKNQKQFMIEFGITICSLIYNELRN